MTLDDVLRQYGEAKTRRDSALATIKNAMEDMAAASAAMDNSVDQIDQIWRDAAQEGFVDPGLFEGIFGPAKFLSGFAGLSDPFKSLGKLF